MPRAKANGAALPGTPPEVKVPPPETPEPIDDSIDGLLRRVARGGRPMMLNLPLDKIEVLPGFVNVRGHNEGAGLKYEDLVESLRVEGQRFPAAAGVQLDESGNPHVYLEDGFRRRAALTFLRQEDARFDTMAVVVESATSADVALRNILSHRREGLPVFLLAVRLSALEDQGMDRAELAARLSLGAETIKQYVNTVKRLCPEAAQAGIAGRISYRLLREVSSYPADVQVKLLEAAASAQRELGDGTETTENSATRAAAAGLREKAAEMRAAGQIPAAKEKKEKKAKETTSSGEGGGGGESTSPPSADAEQSNLPEEPVPAEIPAHNRLPEVELRRRLKLAYAFSDEMNADDRDEVRLVGSLQVDYEELNSAGAALQGYIAGWAAALLYLTGEKCPDCDAELVRLPHDGRKNLPVEHIHSAATE